MTPFSQYHSQNEVCMSRKSKAAEFVQEGYNISITGRNVKITEAMKNYAMEKIAKIERFTQNIIDVSVTMDIQKIDHRVDITMSVDHMKIRGQAACTDMYASIDKAVAKIESQLRRYRERIKRHQAKSVSSIDMNVNVLRSPADDGLLDVNEEIETENSRNLVNHYRPHQIVSRETKPLKTLTYAEAIMKMELSNDVFLVFRAEEDRKKLKIIYRRTDGNYGVMEPEA